MTTPYETAARMPEPGQAAPRFSLNACPEGTVSLDEFIGKKNIILAFYPKDDTPGCTKEMCSFSEDLAEFQRADTEVFGVSCDSLESHERFSAKYKLKLRLLSDADGAVGRSYGVVREGRAMANRVLFVIDKQGVVRHVLEGMPTNAELVKVVSELA